MTKHIIYADWSHSVSFGSSGISFYGKVTEEDVNPTAMRGRSVRLQFPSDTDVASIIHHACYQAVFYPRGGNVGPTFMPQKEINATTITWLRQFCDQLEREGW